MFAPASYHCLPVLTCQARVFIVATCEVSMSDALRTACSLIPPPTFTYAITLSLSLARDAVSSTTIFALWAQC
jgi:hypothetical protein